jgi:hypothetical protein
MSCSGFIPAQQATDMVSGASGLANSTTSVVRRAAARSFLPNSLGFFTALTLAGLLAFFFPNMNVSWVEVRAALPLPPWTATAPGR